MRPIRFRLGVSRLENGTEVMTPFGRLGKTYLYDPLVARRYARLLSALKWIGVVIGATAIVRYYLGKASAEQTFAVFPVSFIVLDCLRVLVAMWLFRHARPMHIVSTLSDDQRREMGSSPGFPLPLQPVATWWLAVPFEVIFFLGSLAAFSLGEPGVAVAAAWAFGFHLLAYALNHLRAQIKGYY